LQEERQSLLHEGSGSAAVNAFVEVVFDNSDNRFSLENSDEVVLRRTVGSKKDEFFLQRKRATKQEVQSLLEGAGFSKSNPYFMVQQGKIQTLCLMTDIQRLQLLQQVAGTTLYEDKKSESLVKMQENAQSIEKINSILADIDQRLNELKGEQEELTVYQSCDRTRKALEYTLYDKELRKARHVLDHLEHERMEHLQELAQLHETAKQTHDHIQNAEGQLKVKSQALKRNRIQLQHSEHDKTKAVTLKTKLDLQCQELQEQVQLGQETLQRTQEDLKGLERQIRDAQDELSQKDQTLKQQQSVLQQLLQEKDQAARKVDGLYAKQGRGKQYASKEERDRSLRKQITEFQNMQREKQDFLTQQQDALGHLRRAVAGHESEITTKQQDVAGKTESLQGIHKTLDEKQKNHYALMDVRKHSWRQAEELQEHLKEARETLNKAVSDVRKSMPRATAMGLKALHNIVEQEGIVVGEQYFGMVMENMKLKDSKYQTAVEVAAQNALFHVIVDTDATAARLMKRLEEGKLGRVTFMPLNRLRVDSNTHYPQSNDVTPLLDTCIEFDPKVSRAMQHVFDKKMLARSAEVASEWSDKVHMDCITLDGDLCSRKGALTGGYVDLHKSRLRAFASQRQAEEAFRDKDQEFHQMDGTAKKAEQDVTNASQEVSRLQHKQSQLSRMLQTIESEFAEQQTQLASQKKQAERIESQILPPLEREIAAFSGDIGRLEEEIGTELTASLSEEDRTLLTQLKQETKDLQDKISRQSETVEELRVGRQKLESLLEDNLLKRRHELTQVYREDESGLVATSTNMLQEQRNRELEDRHQQLRQALKDAEEVDTKLDGLRQVEEELKTELIGAKNELEKLKGKDMKNSKLLDEASERSEKLMSKVCLLDLEFCLLQLWRFTNLNYFRF
jgi:structural maintenance of chromosome 3 (chondroitin sulfate proteoglycan 6)